jgi:hypothetical protein
VAAGIERAPIINIDAPSSSVTTSSTEEKVAVITGGGSGIGQAVAQRKKRTTQQSCMQFGWGWLLLRFCCSCVKLHCRQGYISKCRLLPTTLVVVV